MSTFWEKLMGTSEPLEREAARLRSMRCQRARKLCDDDCGCDFLNKRHHDYAVRHERRVLHNALKFWSNPEAEHPTQVLSDQGVALAKATATDRKGSLEHDIHCIDDITLADLT